MQLGLSPKLYPQLVGLAVGLLVAVLVDETVGMSIVGTALAGLGLGYRQPVGDVHVDRHVTGSDARLPARVLERIRRDPPAA